MMYALLTVAALLFAMQFLFNQQFRKENGDGDDSTVIFAGYTHGISFLIMLLLSGFRLEFTWFSVLVAAIYAIVVLGYNYASLKSFATANLSVFSIYAMLGGMLLPLAYGVIFCDEELSIFKIFCIILIGIATSLSFEKSTTKGNNLKYYLGVFILNGMVGVLSKIHQSNEALAVDSKSFMATVNACVFILCLAYQLIKNKKIAKISLKSLGSISGHAFCNGIGNLFCLIALVSLPASVQFPITTGGVMVFSTIISLIRKEKPSAKTLVSTAVAFVSTVLMMF
ncbi:MAG: hypothetical protein IJD78_07160 [Clostridia bacterium]|nr:hypothetical protein [Clostridia bacterium]MBQ3044333.1 hypothetical protein [Clostridia bacterium]